MNVDLLIAGALFVALGIIFFFLPQAEIKDRPDAKAETPPIPVDSREQKRFELVKLEYEKAAERYDNIYRAVWQNFSYMAALSAGILTFGAGKIPDDFLLVALGLTPLVFWLIAIFMPMDYYGDATRSRLRAIEEDVNKVYLPEEKAPKLGHFLLFRHTKYKWRVRHIVNVSGALIFVGWLFCSVVATHDFMNHFRYPTHDTALERATAARDSLLGITQRLDSVNRMLQITVKCLSAPRHPNQVSPPPC
jgi:hypothetical protein